MDIVERLNGYIAYNTKQTREEDEVMRDAVIEIERLREAVSFALAKIEKGAPGWGVAKDALRLALQKHGTARC